MLMNEDGSGGEVLNMASQEEPRILDPAEKIIQLSSSPSRIGFQPFPPSDYEAFAGDRES